MPSIVEDPPVTGKGAWFREFVAECQARPGQWRKHENPRSPGKATEVNRQAVVLGLPAGTWEAKETHADASGAEAGVTESGKTKRVWLYMRFTPALDGSAGEDGASGSV